jgi:hypothetical protein
MSQKIYPADQHKWTKKVYYEYKGNLSYAVFSNQKTNTCMDIEVMRHEIQS